MKRLNHCHCTGWGHLNVYIIVTALAGSIKMLNQCTFWFIPGPGAAGPGQAGREAGHDNLGQAGHCWGERQAASFGVQPPCAVKILSYLWSSFDLNYFWDLKLSIY